MKSVPAPINEKARLKVLSQYKILDTPPELVFDELAELASIVCKTPIAAISMIDEEREWFKSKIGLENNQFPRNISFSDHTIVQDDLFIVPDTYKNNCFSKNPLVLEEPRLRFYAGVPLITPEGHAVGTICVMDHVPRRLGKLQKNALNILAHNVVAHLELRKKTTGIIGKKPGTVKTDSQLDGATPGQSDDDFRLERKILSNMTEGVVLVRARDGMIMHTTQQFEQMFGYDPGELIGKHVSILNAKTYLQPEETAKNIIAQLNSYGDWSGEIKNIKKDGTSFWCFASITVFEYVQIGTVWLAVHKDITRNKQAEEILNESVLRFRTAMDNSPIGMALVSPEGRWLVVNKALSRIVGYTLDELIELDFQTITHPDDLNADLEQVQKVLNDEIKTYRMEKRYFHKNGHIVWIQLDVSLVRDSSNQPLYFISQIQDITGRKKTLQFLKDSEEKFQKAFVSSPHLMVLNRLSDGCFIEINTTFEKSLGYTREEAIGKTPIELGIWVDPERRSIYTDLLKKNHSVRDFETTVRTKNGAIRTHKLSAEIFNLNNEPCIVSIGEDITEHKQIEESLQKIAEEFAVTSSEEFFRLFTKHIGDTLEADYVIVGELSNKKEDYIESVAVYHNGNFLDPITYEREGSPCDAVIGKRTIGYARNVQDLFPEFTLFATLNIEGYVGTPLFNSNGDSLGIIALLYCNPVNNIETVETLLGIFAIRAASELERKQTEDKIKALSNRNEALVKALGQIVYDWKPVEDSILWEGDYFNILGYTGDDIGTDTASWTDRIHPDDLQYVKDEIDRVIRQQNNLDLDYRFRCKNGSYVWMHDSGITFFDDNGSLIRIIGVFSDITRQRQSREVLEKSQQHLRFLYEENPTMYFTISADGKILSVNSFGAEELGYTVDELTGEPILQVFPEYEHALVLTNLQDCLKNFGEIREWEIQKMRKNGDTLWVRETARAIGTPDGETAVLIVCRDITQSKQAETELQLTHRALHVLSQCNNSMIHASNEQSLLDEVCNIIVKTGNYQLAWVGYPNHDEQKTVTPVAKAGDAEYLDSIIVTWSDDQYGHGPTGTAIRTGKPEIVKDVINDNKFTPWRKIAMKYGFNSVVGLPLIYDDIVIGVLTIYAAEENAFNENELNLLINLCKNLAFGITAQRREKQRKASEEEIIKSRLRLRNLAARLQKAREEERKKIAREIHDELGQTLTGIKMDLSWIQKHLPKNLKNIPEQLQTLILLIDKELETVRNIALSLRPALLDELGLEAAIEWEVQITAKRMGCDYTLNLYNNKILKNSECDTIIFRIFQEAMTNVARHSKANNIHVSLTSEDNKLVLEINDDGIGIQNEKITSINSLGLIGMHERAGAIGGNVQISPIIKGGTRVILEIPTDGLQND